MCRPTQDGPPWATRPGLRPANGGHRRTELCGRLVVGQPRRVRGRTLGCRRLGVLAKGVPDPLVQLRQRPSQLAEAGAIGQRAGADESVAEPSGQLHVERLAEQLSLEDGQHPDDRRRVELRQGTSYLLTRRHLASVAVATPSIKTLSGRLLCSGCDQGPSPMRSGATEGIVDVVAPRGRRPATTSMREHENRTAKP
jgi:hypothetical protein